MYRFGIVNRLQHTIQRLCILLILPILLVACTSAEDMTSESEWEAEEYRVYSALIEEWYIGERTELVVIVENTETQTSPEWFEDVPNRLSGVSEDMIEDFREKNQQSHVLEPLFKLKVEYTLISDQELGRIFNSSRDGWDAFYERFPNSPGYITFSRVGFNSEMTKALVSVGNQSHWRAGAGHLVLLVKEEGSWVVESSSRSWIS